MRFQVIVFTNTHTNSGTDRLPVIEFSPEFYTDQRLWYKGPISNFSFHLSVIMFTYTHAHIITKMLFSDSGWSYNLLININYNLIFI